MGQVDYWLQINKIKIILQNFKHFFTMKRQLLLRIYHFFVILSCVTTLCYLITNVDYMHNPEKQVEYNTTLMVSYEGKEGRGKIQIQLICGSPQVLSTSECLLETITEVYNSIPLLYLLPIKFIDLLIFLNFFYFYRLPLWIKLVYL